MMNEGRAKGILSTKGAGKRTVCLCVSIPNMPIVLPERLWVDVGRHSVSRTYVSVRPAEPAGCYLLALHRWHRRRRRPVARLHFLSLSFQLSGLPDLRLDHAFQSSPLPKFALVKPTPGLSSSTYSAGVFCMTVFNIKLLFALLRPWLGVCNVTQDKPSQLPHQVSIGKRPTLSFDPRHFCVTGRIKFVEANLFCRGQ